MANEKRLIDANAIPYEEHYVPNGDAQWQYKKEQCVLKPAIDAMPTVDAVEVVRCKDCKNNDACSIQDAMNWSRNKEVDDYFCSYGERRENEN